MSKKLLVITTGAILVVLFAVGAYSYQKSQSDQMSAMMRDDSTTFIRPHTPALGPDNAKVLLVEFMDPACGACASFQPLIKELLKKHEGKIRHHVRFASFHENVDKVVMLLQAAKAEGKFWEAKTLLLENQNYWVHNHRADPELALELVVHAGVDEKNARAAMSNAAYESVVLQDLADAKTLGVDKTPTFFVNGKPLPRFGYQQLVDLVESEL